MTNKKLRGVGKMRIENNHLEHAALFQALQVIDNKLNAIIMKIMPEEVEKLQEEYKTYAEEDKKDANVAKE